MMKKYKRIFMRLLTGVLIVAACILPGCTNAEKGSAVPTYLGVDAMCNTWVATDSLGRELATDVERDEKDRFVGLFYWSWHVSHAKNVPDPVNVNQVVTDDPSASHNLDDPRWGTYAMPHHWNEPLYGYYDTDDRWVLRKHAELLAAAGVDVIIFDNTNQTATWKNSYDVIFEVFSKAREDGVRTPQIAFLLPFSASSDSDTQLRMLYDDIYSQGRYSELWFYWKGKPLIMAYPDNMKKSLKKKDREIASFFTFRPCIAQYDRSAEDMKEGFFSKLFDKNQYWNWLSVYPQAVSYNPDGTPEQTTVSVAQNWNGELTAMNDDGVFGRTYTSTGVDGSENAVRKGANFAEQAEYALSVDPEFIFITGWNEWVAGRFEEWCGVTNAFPDEFNDEFSRDIEPSKGELKDDYYYQMVDFIRRYKGTGKTEPERVEKTITSFSDWEDTKVYYSYVNNTFDRDDVGYGNIRYTDTSGRNDIALCKMASDGDNLYFYVECKENITPQTDKNWMRLLLSVPGAENTWEGYSYIVNRLSPAGGKAVIERSQGGWNWEKTGEVDLFVSGNKMYVTVPKSMIGVSSSDFTVDFKWSDNTLSNGDIMNFYLYGDTAPTGRFRYRYVFQK